VIDFELLRAEAAHHPYELLFATVSGAHLFSRARGKAGLRTRWMGGQIGTLRFFQDSSRIARSSQATSCVVFFLDSTS
jgi:hypothetical protein